MGPTWKPRGPHAATPMMGGPANSSPPSAISSIPYTYEGLAGVITPEMKRSLRFPFTVPASADSSHTTWVFKHVRRHHSLCSRTTSVYSVGEPTCLCVVCLVCHVNSTTRKMLNEICSVTDIATHGYSQPRGQGGDQRYMVFAANIADGLSMVFGVLP